MDRRAFALVLAATLAVHLPHRSEGAELYFTYREGTLDRDETVFLQRLTNARKVSLGPLADNLTPGYLYTDSADLNGDGVKEIFVFMTLTGSCGTDPGCTVSIFRKSADDWALAGEAYGIYVAGSFADDPTRSRHMEGRRPLGSFLFVEDTWVNGWRVLNDGAKRYCWKPAPTGRSAVEYKAASLGWPYTVGQAGYWGRSRIDEPCPHPGW